MWLQELHEKRVTLIEGTALSERDLVRARAESTGAILLLADRFSADAKQEDLSVQFQVRQVPDPTTQSQLQLICSTELCTLCWLIGFG